MCNRIGNEWRIANVIVQVIGMHVSTVRTYIAKILEFN